MSIAEHNVVLKPDDKHERDKFLASCSCGTEGRFPEEADGLEWAFEHLKGINSPNKTFQNLVHVKAHSA